MSVDDGEVEVEGIEDPAVAEWSKFSYLWMHDDGAHCVR